MEDKFNYYAIKNKAIQSFSKLLIQKLHLLHYSHFYVSELAYVSIYIF